MFEIHMYSIYKDHREMYEYTCFKMTIQYKLSYLSLLLKQGHEIDLQMEPINLY